MSYELLFQKAIELHQNGALNEAERIYRQILETAPQNADVLNLLGLIAQAKGIHYEAANYFYRAVEYAPKHFPIFFNLAVSLAALGRFVEATEAYQKALALKPDLKEAYYGLANIYWQQANKVKAAEMFEKALELDANYAEAEAGFAELTDNEEKLEELCVKYPSFAMPFYYLGRRYLNAEKFSEAENMLQKADGLAQSDEIKLLLGESLLKQEKNAEALKFFYQAVQLNGQNAVALLHIADIETENQNFADAEKYYRKAIEYDAKNACVHVNYANMLCKRKRTLEALEEYRAAVILAPDTPEICYNLAIVLKTLEEYEQALALMFQAYYQENREAWSLSLVETLILFYQKEPEKAKKIVQNWLEKMPENVAVKHLNAVFKGEEFADKAAYDKLLFDNFAEVYEQTLKDINYCVIDKITELQASFSGVVFDLGCGTGLVGERFKTAENSFIGVDLSPKMLEKAKQKNVYDELIEADILSFLEQRANEKASIVAADVFCYFGSLDKLISLCAPKNIIFSIETSSDCEKYAVQANGRFKHNPQYVKELLKKAGYNDIVSVSCALRKESGNDVEGMLFKASV